MRGGGILAAAVLVVGCAQGGDPEPSVLTSFGGPSVAPGTDSDEGEDTEAGSGGGDTVSPVGSGGQDGGATSDGSTGGLDSTGGDEDADDDATTDEPVAMCPPDPGDDACFSCARDHCCPQVQACEADPVCNCTIDCIAQGGDPGVCNEDCGGMNKATVNLLGCSYVQCPKCEKL